MIATQPDNLNTLESDGATLIHEIGYKAFQKLQDSTTEQRLADVRTAMRYYRPAQTFGREHGRIEGYYYTERIDVGRV